jgi:hypothetical protein
MNHSYHSKSESGLPEAAWMLLGVAAGALLLGALLQSGAGAS